jgi:uracil-DNA glycosylase family 4
MSETNKPVNPYNLLWTWLFDRNLNSPIPEECIPLSSKYFLLNLIKNPKVCHFINTHLNNFSIHALDKEDTLKLLKELCYHFNITKRDLLYIPYKKVEDKQNIDKVRQKLPHFKRDEIRYILDNFSDNDEVIEVLYVTGIIDENDKKSLKERAKKRKEEEKNKKMKFDEIINYFKDLLKSQSNEKCKICPLFNNDLVLFDTNVKTDISKTDVLFIAEAPGADEVKKGIPLIGRSGQKLRQFISKYLTPRKVKWFMTNTCLCRPDNNATPNDLAIDCCNSNLLYTIDKTDPKVIVLLGSTSLKTFGFNDLKISKIDGTVLEWIHPQNNRKYKIVPMLHPSAIIRNAFPESRYDLSFTSLVNVLEDKEPPITINSDDNKNTENLENLNINLEINDHYNNVEESQPKNNWFLFNYPKEYNDLYLVDVHTIYGEPYYIFRDQNGKKIIKKYDDYNNYYFWENKNGKFIENIDESRLHLVNYNDYTKNRNTYDTKYLYEGDLSLANRHTIEFLSQFNQRYDNPKIMFFDIEVYRKGYLGFPDPKEAKYPINAISYYFDGKYYLNLLLNSDNPENKKILDSPQDLFNDLDDDIKDLHDYKNNLQINTFTDEKDLIKHFINMINNVLQPDVITAWNISFDIGYIYNRMLKLGLDPNHISPLKTSYVDMNRHFFDFPGLIILDMMSLYKGFTFEGRESYSLSFIARLELKDDKIQYEGDLDRLYIENIKKFILYNIKDTNLIVRLNSKLKHIELLNSMRQIAKCTWTSGLSVSTMVDTLVVSYLKTVNKCVRNFVKEYQTDGNLLGAYVKTPKGGLFQYVVDFDFTSLYPNLIRTYNIGPDTYISRVDEDYAFNWLYRKDIVKNKDVTMYTNVLENEIVNTIPYNTFEEFMKDKIMTVNGCIYLSHKQKKSILHNIVTELLEQRVIYKNKMKDATKNKDTQKRETYNNYQLAFKVLANSIYGALGFNFSRYFNIHMARSITISGREAIKWCAINIDDEVIKLTNNLDILLTEVNK